MPIGSAINVERSRRVTKLIKFAPCGYIDLWTRHTVFF
jgi:hypothetical protein